jgi:hypothetical protein
VVEWLSQESRFSLPPDNLSAPLSVVLNGYRFEEDSSVANDDLSASPALCEQKHRFKENRSTVFRTEPFEEGKSNAKKLKKSRSLTNIRNGGMLDPLGPTRSTRS